jgi:hypothetical protein
MRFVLLLFFIYTLLGSLQCISATNILRFAILGGSFGYPDPVFPDLATAVEYGAPFYQYIDALYNSTDMYFNLVNNAGGIPLHDSYNTKYEIQYTIFNLDWIPYYYGGTLQPMIDLAERIVNGTEWGHFDVVVQSLIPPEFVPIMSQMCIDKCIVLNNTPPQDYYYICDNTMQDCINSGKRNGYRRFPNTYTPFRDFAELADNQLALWFYFGVNNVAIVVSDDSQDAIILQGLRTAAEGYYMNIVSVNTIISTPDLMTHPVHYFDSFIDNWKSKNVEAIIMVGTSTNLVYNWTMSIQNLLICMRDNDYIPLGVGFNVASLDRINPELYNYMWTNLNWDSSLRGPDFISTNTVSNFEIYPATSDYNSPAVFVDTFLNTYPQYKTVGKSAYVSLAINMAGYILIQKLIETAGSINYDAINAASNTVNSPSFFGRIQFDAYGRLTTISGDSIVAMINSTQTSYTFNIIYPLAHLNTIVYPIPTWSERKYTSQSYGSTLEAVFIFFTLVIILCIKFILLWTYYHSHHQVVKAASPKFLSTFLLGNSLMLCTIFSYNLDPDNINCGWSVWLFCIGFDFMFWSVALKNLRIAQIFRMQRLTVINITDYDIFLKLAVFISFKIVWLAIWTGSVGMNSVLIIPDPFRIKNNYHQCLYDSKESPFIIITIVWNFLLVFCSSLVAWYTRNVTTAFNESKQIAGCIYSTLLVGSLFIGLIGIGSFSHTTTYIVVCVGIWMCTITNVSIMYLSKFDMFWNGYTMSVTIAKNTPHDIKSVVPMNISNGTSAINFSSGDSNEVDSRFPKPPSVLVQNHKVVIVPA